MKVTYMLLDYDVVSALLSTSALNTDRILRYKSARFLSQSGIIQLTFLVVIAADINQQLAKSNLWMENLLKTPTPN